MTDTSNKKLKVFTWHIHGSYLYYLTQANCDFYIPYRPDGKEGYGGRAGSFPWGENVHQIDEEEVKSMDFDVIVYQSKNNFFKDQYEILSEKQRQLPKIYIEHDPPREHPTDTKHIVDDPDVLLVHVTHFNKLMWDNNRTPSIVIDHGVTVPENVSYKGTKEKGIVVINNIKTRGRRLGYDVFEEVKRKVPLDYIGMGSQEVGGIGEIPHQELPEFISHYRFFFNPIRYTSLGLSVCEAMMIGMPIVGLATTEMVTAVKNDYNGYIATDIDRLIEKMRFLLDNPKKAKNLSKGAHEYATKRFSIKRFAHDWEYILHEVTNKNITSSLEKNVNVSINMHN